MAKKILNGALVNTTPEDDAQTAADAAAYAALANAVPSAISRMQARVALTQAGKLAAIDAYFASAQVDAPTREYWQSAAVFHRDHPLVVGLAPALGWTTDQLDNLFRTAKAIA